MNSKRGKTLPIKKSSELLGGILLADIQKILYVEAKKNVGHKEGSPPNESRACLSMFEF
jgi:hypothetical protein